MTPPGPSRDSSRARGGIVDQEPDRISRRRLLKQLGAGTAVAWSAPVLTSMRTPVFAQASPICAPFDCENQLLCGNPGAHCPMPPGCERAGCTMLVNHSCLCFDTYDCF